LRSLALKLNRNLGLLSGLLRSLGLKQNRNLGLPSE